MSPPQIHTLSRVAVSVANGLVVMLTLGGARNPFAPRDLLSATTSSAAGSPPPDLRSSEHAGNNVSLGLRFEFAVPRYACPPGKPLKSCVPHWFRRTSLQSMGLLCLLTSISWLKSWTARIYCFNYSSRFDTTFLEARSEKPAFL